VAGEKIVLVDAIADIKRKLIGALRANGSVKLLGHYVLLVILLLFLLSLAALFLLARCPPCKEKYGRDDGGRLV
jgi:hypothetical protein